MRLSTEITLICILICLCMSSAFGQPKPDDLYEKLRRLRLFESSRQDIESMFKFTDLTESKEGADSKTVYYDLLGANLDVDYSTGGCSAHKSDTGFDVDRDIAIRISLSYHDPRPLSNFPFELKTFRKHTEPESNAVIFTSDAVGILLTGGEKVLRSIEYFPTKTQKSKLGCK